MLIVGLLLAIAPASASTVTVQFVGMSGANQNGEYTYPYYLTINGGPPTWMMCDDFYDRIGVGDTWQANITQLSSGDMSLTRFGDLDQVSGSGVSAAANQDHRSLRVGQHQLGDLGHLRSQCRSRPYLPGVEYWLNKAETVDLSTIDFSGVRILLPQPATTARNSSS